MSPPDYVAVDPRHEAFEALAYDPLQQVSNAQRAQTLATIYVGDQLGRIADVLERVTDADRGVVRVAGGF